MNPRNVWKRKLPPPSFGDFANVSIIDCHLKKEPVCDHCKILKDLKDEVTKLEGCISDANLVATELIALVQDLKKMKKEVL